MRRRTLVTRQNPLGLMLYVLAALVYAKEHPLVGYVVISYFAVMSMRYACIACRLPSRWLAVAQFFHWPMLIWLLTANQV